MTLIVPERAPAPSVAGGDPTRGRLVAWAEALSAAHQIGSALCSTAFAPVAFRGKPDEAAAAILFGDEIGFTPTQALRSIFVISGQPSMYARAMVALVLGRGHSVWTKQSSDDKVTVCGQRRGSDNVEEVTWTTARARKAGYTSNKKYESDPQAMLYARAAADVCRRIAPDALAGVAYAVEELEDDDAAKQPRRTVARARTTATVTELPEPPLVEPVEPEAKQSALAEPPLEPPTPAASNDDEDGITKSQLAKIGAAMRDLNITGRDEALLYVADKIGHEIASRSDLTKPEASKVIEALEADAAWVAEPADKAVS